MIYYHGLAIMHATIVGACQIFRTLPRAVKAVRRLDIPRQAWHTDMRSLAMDLPESIQS